MGKHLFVALLLLLACVAGAFAEDSGETGNVISRRTLTNAHVYNGPAYPKQCRKWGDQRNFRKLAKCCYDNGYRNQDTIYKICRGFGIETDINIIIKIIGGHG